MVVADQRELTAFVRRCLADPAYAQSLGRAARQFVASQLGATARIGWHAKVAEARGVSAQQVALADWVVFSVPSVYYPFEPEFGDERLLPLEEWQRILAPFNMAALTAYGDPQHGGLPSRCQPSMPANPSAGPAPNGAEPNGAVPSAPPWPLMPRCFAI